MSFSYNVIFHDNHIILELTDKSDNNNNVSNSTKQYALVDTGSPVTMGEQSLLFCDRRFKTHSNHIGTSVSKLSEFINHPLDFLIGEDVLLEFNYEITKTKMIFYDKHYFGNSFNNNNSDLICQLPLTRVMGIPLIQIKIKDEENNLIQMFFDTGAKISYIIPSLIKKNEFQFVGEGDDFYPTIGKFKTKMYVVPLQFSNEKTFSLKCGTLPSSLNQLLLIAPNTKGIVGSELLEYCNIFMTNDSMYLYSIDN
ncbi:hypothetical protein ABK040_014477 [Willaertia magna]